MSNIKKLCGFCINEWHLTTMVLPYISKEINNNYKIITILEKGIEENIKLLIKKLNLKIILDNQPQKLHNILHKIQLWYRDWAFSLFYFAI